MGHEIVLKLTLGEANYLSELLGKYNYGYGNEARYSVVEKLESERSKALKIVAKAIEGELNG